MFSQWTSANISIYLFLIFELFNLVLMIIAYLSYLSTLLIHQQNLFWLHFNLSSQMLVIQSSIRKK